MINEHYNDDVSALNNYDATQTLLSTHFLWFVGTDYIFIMLQV